MGVSWYHKVTAVFSDNQKEWLDNLPERLSGTPVHAKASHDRVVTFNSSGYGIFDLNAIDWPTSLIGMLANQWHLDQRFRIQKN